MKIVKYSLLSALFISSASFATEAPQEQITLPSLFEVASFCSSDKSCNSITPVVDESELKYKVKYENASQAEDDTNTPANSDPMGSGL